jgi:hypothetical protein
MKNILINLIAYLFILQLLFSCNALNNKPEEKSSMKTNNKISNKNNYVELGYQNPKKEKKKHDYSKFPEDFVITETGPDCEEYRFFFFSDKKVIIQDLFTEDDYSIGVWRYEKDTIKIETYRIMGRVAFGKELIPEGYEGVDMCKAWEYEDYYNYNYESSNKYTITLEELKIGNWFRIDSMLFASDFKIDEINYPSDGDYLFASFELLDSTFLSKYSKKELRLIRNEIFARYGYIFKSEDLISYFQGKSWYKPKRKNVDHLLTEREKKNIELILMLENK